MSEGILIPVSVGELADKISILDIKVARIGEAGKRANVEKERAALLPLLAALMEHHPGLDALYEELRAVNTRMWEIQDALRGHEARQAFGADFIALARGVYHTNAGRITLKGRINRLAGSRLVEEKQYAATTDPSAVSA